MFRELHYALPYVTVHFVPILVILITLANRWASTARYSQNAGPIKGEIIEYCWWVACWHFLPSTTNRLESSLLSDMTMIIAIHG